MASRYIQRFEVPEGFCDILHDFAGEVLRAQPDDILDFAANYFECKSVGQEYYYECKSTVGYEKAVEAANKRKKQQPSQQSSVHHSQEAKHIVQASNQRLEVPSKPDSAKSNPVVNQNKPLSQVAQSRPQSTSSKNSEHRPGVGSSRQSDASHLDEKRLTKDFVGELYNSALQKALKTEENNEGDDSQNPEEFQEEVQFEQGSQQEEREELERSGNREHYDLPADSSENQGQLE